MSMSELKLQSWIINQIKQEGGAGVKLSNRFLTGVPDLLLKPKDFPACVVEVKVGKYYKSTNTWRWEPTKLQLDFLKEWRDAGMVTAVVVGFGEDLSDFRLAWVNNLDLKETSNEAIMALPSKKEYRKADSNMITNLLYRGITNDGRPHGSLR